MIIVRRPQPSIVERLARLNELPRKTGKRTRRLARLRYASGDIAPASTVQQRRAAKELLKP